MDEGNGTGTIEIEARKTYKGNTKFWRIMAISGVLGKNNLPKYYLEREPYMYFDAEKGEIIGSVPSEFFKSEKQNNLRIVLKSGSLYTNAELKESMDFVRACGLRLHAINAEWRKQRQTWQGTEIFKI